MAKWKDEMEELKKQMLPKTLNLHSMVTTGVEYVSEPTFIEDVLTRQLSREEQAWTFTLEDLANNMQVTVKIVKTVHHELKD